jgi:hypothetical protein
MSHEIIEVTTSRQVGMVMGEAKQVTYLN